MKKIDLIRAEISSLIKHGESVLERYKRGDPKYNDKTIDIEYLSSFHFHRIYDCSIEEAETFLAALIDEIGEVKTGIEQNLNISIMRGAQEIFKDWVENGYNGTVTDN